VFEGKSRISISESDEISKNRESPGRRTPKSTLRHVWSGILQFPGRASRLEFEQEITPLVVVAPTEAVVVKRSESMKTQTRRIVRPFALSF
jgi:hypothetical protein